VPDFGCSTSPSEQRMQDGISVFFWLFVNRPREPRFQFGGAFYSALHTVNADSINIPAIKTSDTTEDDLEYKLGSHARRIHERFRIQANDAQANSDDDHCYKHRE